MTLIEQITQIHAKHFNKEFHDYRQGIIPAMVNDLAEKFFDSMVQTNSKRLWVLDNDLEVRAVKKARELISRCGLRDNTPAVE